jgi:hypothetical protein
MHIRNNFIFSRQGITQESKTLKFQNVSYKEIMESLKKSVKLTFYIVFWENYPGFDGVILFAGGAK